MCWRPSYRKLSAWWPVLVLALGLAGCETGDGSSSDDRPRAEADEPSRTDDSAESDGGDDPREGSAAAPANTSNDEGTPAADASNVDPRSDKPLNAARAKRVLNENEERFRRCYELRLKKNANAEGKVTVEFTVGRKGKVVDTTVERNDTGGNVGACVTNAIETLEFPAPRDGAAEFRKTFDFRAK